MIAKYATRCTVCPEPIRPGEQIAAVRGAGSGGWAHLSCHAGAALAEAPAETASRKPKATPAGKKTRPAPSAMPVPPGALEVYTDGACSGNPGPGGWAWAVADGRQDSGAETPSTNQRMEIRAALEAVRSLDGPLLVVSDSTYVVTCFRDGWWRRWLANSWLTSAKKPVANQDLWEPLVDLVAAREDVAFHWVKGHSGHPMNDLADRLAVAAAARGGSTA